LKRGVALSFTDQCLVIASDGNHFQELFDKIIELWKKGRWFIAKCPELDFISQGKTRDKDRKNLIEVIKIQFEKNKK
jgi:predicted RNase H-like HicB family nuclease